MNYNMKVTVMKNDLLNNETLISGMFGLLGMVVTGAVSFFVAKNKDKKEQSAQDKQQKSVDQQQFIDDLYERMTILEEQLNKYRVQVEEYHERSIALQEEVMQWKNKYVELDREWRYKYISLEMENKELQNKVVVLEDYLKKMPQKPDVNIILKGEISNDNDT